MVMASQHLILRTECSGGADHVPAAPPQADDPDQQKSNPSSSSSSAHRHPTQQQQRRHPGQKVGRAPLAGTATSSTTSAAAIRQRLESPPIWCDVTVLSEVASVAGKRSNHHGENSNARTSHQGSNDDGTGLTGSSTSNVDSNASLDKPHVVKRQRFNPCGMDNVLVFPSSSSSGSSSSTSTISTSTSSYLLRLSSCWTSSSLLSLGDGDDTINRGGSDTAKSEFAPTSNKEEDGSNAKEGLELLLDLPVRPHPATLAFTTAESTSNGDDDGIFAESVSKIGGSSGSAGTPLLTVEFDLSSSYKALEGIVAKKEHERHRVEDAKAKPETKRLAGMMKWSMWNPLSSWWYPNGGGGGGDNNSSGGIPTKRDELERMLDEMLLERSYNAKRQHHFEVGGRSLNLSTTLHGREDLLILQAAMDREIRDLNIMLSGLGLVGLALVGSYVYTVRRIWNRRPTSASASALASGTATPGQDKRQRTPSAASSDAQSYGRGFGDGVRVPPPISTIQIVRDTVVQGLGMANIGNSLKAAVGAGAPSVSAAFSPSKSDGESVSTAPSTPETPSPRAKKQVGQRQHGRQVKEQVKEQELKGKEESPQEAAKPMVAEKKKQISPERKEIINALLARVKAPTPVKPAERDEGGKNNSTAGEKKMPTAVMATPEKNPAAAGVKQKQAVGKANEEHNAPITPIPSRRPMAGRKPVGGTVGGAFTSVPDDESSAAVTPASNQTPDIFAPTSRASAIDFGGILGGGSNAATKTPALTPMRNKEGGVRGEGSSKLGQSKTSAISADPRGSPSFAEMLLQKQQQLTPPKEEPSNKPAAQGSSSLGGSLKKKKVQPQRQKKQQQSKPRRKLTPPPKSKAGDASASAASGGFEDGSGNDTMIQGRNLNDAIENTFFRDYWDE